MHRLARNRYLHRLVFGSTAATLIRCASTHAKEYKAAGGGSGEIMRMNADFSQSVAVDTTEMEWVASPIKNVERKRVFLHGTKEAGKVTSVVRYAPGSSFHQHPHPEGEEFLVLKGIFSDHSGDYGPGTYCLNPEGFVHAPSSKPGCEIIVRLRQHPNLKKSTGFFSWFFGSKKDRSHIVVLPEEGKWEPMADWGSGVSRKMLYEEKSEGYDDSTWFEKIGKGSSRTRVVPQGMAEEVFVIEGNVKAASTSEGTTGTWIRNPEGESQITASDDSFLYVRQYPVEMVAPALN
mmetsp:Transcript_248/g.390  ORF Transcript_248/g.390 Transcript_248/m.390 type:complete len:291 (+) Transcript_248:181-1053(+)|eukprot:CAMPEP_0167751828 /NCGR_PEP_ID=MMETSP0110_2-20121227/6796_1 /TAXON_ID=629695 /ORGANISM="Gymnochlora sp., Strain CCMP2014" /LENGTH=290 /DNA_ID=CAMNT_0007637369 /DNA_START=107 /DNA_END=979 /DNA_ORIENTATION=+